MSMKQDLEHDTNGKNTTEPLVCSISVYNCSFYQQYDKEGVTDAQTVLQHCFWEVPH